MNFYFNTGAVSSSLSSITPACDPYKSAASPATKSAARLIHIFLGALKTMPKEPLLYGALAGGAVHTLSQAAFNRGYIEGSLRNRVISALSVAGTVGAVFAIQVTCRVQLAVVIIFSVVVAGGLEALSGSKLYRLNKEIADAKKETADTKEELERANQEITTLQASVPVPDTPAKSAQPESKELQELREKAGKYSEMLESLDGLQAVTKRLEAAITEAEKKKEELEGQLDAASSDYLLLVEESEKASQASRGFEQRCEQLDTLLTSANAQISDLENKVSSKEAAFGNLREELASVKAQLREATARSASPGKPALKATVSQLRRSVEKKDIELQQANADAETEMQRLHDEIERLRSECVTRELEWETEKADLNGKIIESQGEMTALSTQLEGVEAVRQRAEAQLEELQEDLKGEKAAVAAFQGLWQKLFEKVQAFGRSEQDEEVMSEGPEEARQRPTPEEIEEGLWRAAKVLAGEEQVEELEGILRKIVAFEAGHLFTACITDVMGLYTDVEAEEMPDGHQTLSPVKSPGKRGRRGTFTVSPRTLSERRRTFTVEDPTFSPPNGGGQVRVSTSSEGDPGDKD